MKNRQDQTPFTCDELPPTVNTGEILDAIDTAVLVVDAKGTIRFRNAAAKAWLARGDDLESAAAQARLSEPPGGWAAFLCQAHGTVRTRKCECRVIRTPKDEFLSPFPGNPGEPTLLRCRGTPLRLAGGGEAGVILLLEARREPDAVHGEGDVLRRLAALGKVAVRVAHELNNPLDGILRYVNLAVRAAESAPDDRLKSYLTESRTGLLRMMHIVGDLLEFSRSADGESEEMSVNDVVAQAVRSTAGRAETAGVAVTTIFQDHDMPLVSGSRLYQVCCNLVKNALDAMPDGGRLTVTTSITDHHVVIQVQDTGVGLPHPVDRIFEPFFTTKAPGQGTGLGLAICKEFIEDMHGTIVAGPAPERGALFTVRIPVTSLRHTPALPPPRRRAKSAKTLRA